MHYCYRRKTVWLIRRWWCALDLGCTGHKLCYSLKYKSHIIDFPFKYCSEFPSKVENLLHFFFFVFYLCHVNILHLEQVCVRQFVRMFHFLQEMEDDDFILFGFSFHCLVLLIIFSFEMCLCLTHVCVCTSILQKWFT